MGFVRACAVAVVTMLVPPVWAAAISKYRTSLFGELGITDDDNSDRRILAVLTYLGLTGS